MKKPRTQKRVANSCTRSGWRLASRVLVLTVNAWLVSACSNPNPFHTDSDQWHQQVIEAKR